MCLPWKKNDPGQDLKSSDKLVVTGWGRTTNDEIEAAATFDRFNVSTPILQKVELTELAHEECIAQFAFRNVIRAMQLCAAGEKGKQL